MASEVTVCESIDPRWGAPFPVAPFLAVQTLSIGGAVSAALTSATRIAWLYTTTACHVEFSNIDGTAPNGAGAGSGVIPLPATTWTPIIVRSGDKVIAVA